MIYQNATFETYNPVCKEAEHELEKIKKWVDDFNCEKGGNLLLQGNVGTGKTHLCHALFKACETSEHRKLKRRHGNDDDKIVQAIIERAGKKICRFPEIVRDVRDRYNYTDYEKVKKYHKLNLLIIDDVGAGGWSENDSGLLEEILLGRNERKFPTVISTNLTALELKRKIGERSYDRLKHFGCVVCDFTWSSYRK